MVPESEITVEANSQISNRLLIYSLTNLQQYCYITNLT